MSASILRSLASREAGGAAKFPRTALSSCSSFVSRLTAATVLEGHTGCVNSIHWNHDGSLLLTGSDDTYVTIWSGNTYRPIHRVKTGNVRNIFSARFVPQTNDTQFVSAGMDGQVRLVDISGETKTTLLAAHGHDMVYKVTFLPDQPRVFVTTQQDSTVRLYDLRQDSAPQMLLDLRSLNLGEYGVNTLAFDPLGSYRFALGCSDPYLRIYDIRKPTTHVSAFISGNIKRKLDTAQRSLFSPGYYITGVDWSSKGELAVTYSRDHVYTFDAQRSPDDDAPQVGRVCTVFSQKYFGSRNVRTFLKEVAFLGGDQYVASGSDCGHLYIWSRATGALVQCLRADAHVVNGVAPHPYLLKIATCGIDSEGKVWDVGADTTFNERKAKAAQDRNAGGTAGGQESDSEGGEGGITINQLLALMRRNPQALPRGVVAQLRQAMRASGAGGDVESEGEEEAEGEQEGNDQEDDDDDDDVPAALQMNMEQVAAEMDEVEKEKDRGNELFRSNQWQQARECYTVALQRLGNVPVPPPTARHLRARLKGLRLVTLMNRAAAYVRESNATEAIVDCNAALEIDPDNLKAIYRRGCAYLLASRFEEAEQDAVEALRQSPGAPEIRRLLNAARGRHQGQLY